MGFLVAHVGCPHRGGGQRGLEQREPHPTATECWVWRQEFTHRSKARGSDQKEVRKFPGSRAGRFTLTKANTAESQDIVKDL